MGFKIEIDSEVILKQVKWEDVRQQFTSEIYSIVEQNVDALTKEIDRLKAELEKLRDKHG